MDSSLVDDVVAEGVRNKVFPGACFGIGSSAGFQIGVAGRVRYDEGAPAVHAGTVWDLASVTKVAATTTAAISLTEAGILDLDQPLRDVIPEFAAPSIRLRNLLLHDSGLPASHPNPTSFTEPRTLLADVVRLAPEREPGVETVYSDVGFILLAEALSRLAGVDFEQLILAQVLERLSLMGTSFKPVRRHDCAPTERVEAWRRALRKKRHSESPELECLETAPDGTRWIVGEVHDPTAAVLGGIAGHAGLFSTIQDMCMFMQWMLLNHSRSEFVRRAHPQSSRALGWDTPSDGSSAGNRFGPRSFGHTGFTGTSVWADPDRDLFAVLLTNRVHPSAANLAIKAFRREFHDAVVEASH